MQKIPPTGAQYPIRSGEHAAVVVEVGGGLRTYEVAGQPVVDGYAEDELPPGAAGQVLAPWPNRLRDGRYTWNGEEHQLALSEVPNHNAIHGLVRWLPWQPVSASDSAVTLACVLPPHPGYPWRLELGTTWSFGAAGLEATHTATNLSDSPAPFGLGLHPYLTVPGTRVDDIVLTIPADQRLIVDARKLPLGARPVAGTDWDFTQGRRIGSAQLDTAFGGNGAVVLASPGGDRRVMVWADEQFRWWQLFTADTLAEPRRRRSVAVEPMTCPPDAYHSGRDLVTLAPGEAWRARWGITASGI
jgi:aldose 1-epimerase